MSARRQRGKWYYRRWVRFPDGGRERIFGVPSTFGLPNTKVGALEAERCAVEKALRGKPAVVEPQTRREIPTVKEFAVHFMAVANADNRPSSAESKQTILDRHLLPLLGGKRLGEVRFADIEDVKLALLGKPRELAPKTVNNVLTVLRALLDAAKRREVIAAVPEIPWCETAPPEFDFLDFDEADRLIGTARDEWRCMVLVAARTGMRQGELLGLRWEDVDLLAGKLTLRQAIVRGRVGQPKSGKPREIPLSAEALAALKGQRHLRGELVFCDQAGHPLTKGECKHPLWSACKRAGLRRIGWHVLRHTFASHLAMRGAPLKVIQELLGHATITMTMRYAHLAPEVSREAVKLLDRSGIGWASSENGGEK